MLPSTAIMNFSMIRLRRLGSDLASSARRRSTSAFSSVGARSGIARWLTLVFTSGAFGAGLKYSAEVASLREHLGDDTNTKSPRTKGETPNLTAENRPGALAETR